MGRIFLAADAKSQNLKALTKGYLDSHGYEYSELGAKTDQDEQDITDFVPDVMHKIGDTDSSAILICGNGIGVAICANRFKGVRAVMATTPEFAAWGKTYDDCNVLCLAEWHTGKGDVDAILDAWFATSFDALPRRVARVGKMDRIIAGTIPGLASGMRIDQK